MNDLQGKYQVLLNYLKELGSVAIAFSGGVDSTFLLAAAKEALGDNVIALTAKSCLFPESESGEAEEFCKNIGVKQIRNFHHFSIIRQTDVTSVRKDYFRSF